MTTGQKFDVIIIGGGPAGLGSAIHLAEKGMKVLLLEKNKIGLTQKTWLTFDYIVEKYGLEESVRNRFSGVIFSCYLGNIYSFKRNDFIFPIHEERALGLLAQRAKNSGATLKDEEAFIHYTVKENEHIKIRSTKGTYSAKLAVDAMGRNSPILKSHGLKNDILDMGCLAYFLEGVTQKNDNELLLYDSFFPGSDYFWVVPLENDRMIVGIFFFSPLTGSNLKERTEKLKWYIEARHINGDVYDMRKGNIPLGPQSQVHIDHFISIGDSCNTPLPSSGFSFSRCLEESKVLADFAAKHLNDEAPLKDYRKAILGEKIPGIEIHLIISDMLSKFTDPMLNKAIGAMNKLNEDFLISFLSGRDMSINFAVSALRAILNTFSLSEIRSLSLKQNYLKNLMNLYDLLLALPQAKIRAQIVDFVKGLIKKEALLSADSRAIDLSYRSKVDQRPEKSLDTPKPNTHNFENDPDSL